MFRSYRSLCYIRVLSANAIRFLPRAATASEPPSAKKSSDYAVINSPQNALFNDYNVLPSKVQSRPVPKSVPKLVDVQTGLNHFIEECNESLLLTMVENKYRLFDGTNVAMFIQRLQELNIKRDSQERYHQRLYDFVDFFSTY